MYEYLGLRHISGAEAMVYVSFLAILCVAYVLWHARKRLKVSKDALRETEWPGR